MNKRLTGYLNWTRARAHIHDMGVLAGIVADIKAHAPSHVAMTGDILNIGLPAEFPLARTWLETLGAPDNVSFVPGNHDAYVRGSLPDLVQTFAPWTTGDATTSAGYPYLRVRGDIALIGLSSGVPTPPFIASGRLGERQRNACEAVLAETARRGLIRVVMLHHPPTRTGATFGRGLRDALAFEALIGRVGAELIIHGHNHRLSVAHIPGSDKRVPVVGVASASALHGTPDHRAGYNLFRIDGDRSAYRIEGRVRGILPGTIEIGDLGPIGL